VRGVERRGKEKVYKGIEGGVRRGEEREQGRERRYQLAIVIKDFVAHNLEQGRSGQNTRREE
jgi:hypothetical protein